MIEERVAIRGGRFYRAAKIKQFDHASNPINLVPHPSILAPPQYTRRDSNPQPSVPKTDALSN